MKKSNKLFLLMAGLALSIGAVATTAYISDTQTIDEAPLAQTGVPHTIPGGIMFRFECPLEAFRSDGTSISIEQFKQGKITARYHDSSFNIIPIEGGNDVITDATCKNNNQAIFTWKTNPALNETEAVFFAVSIKVPNIDHAFDFMLPYDRIAADNNLDYPNYIYIRDIMSPPMAENITIEDPNHLPLFSARKEITFENRSTHVNLYLARKTYKANQFLTINSSDGRIHLKPLARVYAGTYDKDMNFTKTTPIDVFRFKFDDLNNDFTFNYFKESYDQGINLTVDELTLDERNNAYISKNDNNYLYEFVKFDYDGSFLKQSRSLADDTYMSQELGKIIFDSLETCVSDSDYGYTTIDTIEGQFNFNNGDGVINETTKKVLEGITLSDRGYIPGQDTATTTAYQKYITMKQLAAEPNAANEILGLDNHVMTAIIISSIAGVTLTAALILILKKRKAAQR